MALTEEQSTKIKEHLLGQLQNFPEDRKKQIKEQLESMNSQQLENFIQQNQLTHLGGKCIFCSIISGENKSFKIAENKENIAILEINPLSKGHTLIIPKDHIKEMPESSKKMAEDISTRLKERLKPSSIKVDEKTMMGHQILEIIPLYGNEKERYSESEEILEKIREEITKNEKEIKIEPKREEIKIVRLPPRIP